MSVFALDVFHHLRRNRAGARDQPRSRGGLDTVGPRWAQVFGVLRRFGELQLAHPDGARVRRQRSGFLGAAAHRLQVRSIQPGSEQGLCTVALRRRQHRDRTPRPPTQRLRSKHRMSRHGRVHRAIRNRKHRNRNQPPPLQPHRVCPARERPRSLVRPVRHAVRLRAPRCRAQPDRHDIGAAAIRTAAEHDRSTGCLPVRSMARCGGLARQPLGERDHRGSTRRQQPREERRRPPGLDACAGQPALEPGHRRLLGTGAGRRQYACALDRRCRPDLVGFVAAARRS